MNNDQPAVPFDNSRNRTSPPHGDDLRRLLMPQPTNTWLDDVELPKGQTWDEHTPASICRESAATRLIFAAFEPNSCTFSATDHPRWGVESLRIPALKDDPLRGRPSRTIEQVRPGDCLLTVGPKFRAPADQLEFEDAELEDLQGTLAWFPQPVVRVKPEGEGHLRVWVARDNHVMNDNADPDDLGLTRLVGAQETVIMNDDDAQTVYQHFQLNVFCAECGNRAKPIVYGMPTGEDPSYLAIGGCIFEENAPNYICSCGHSWNNRPNEEWLEGTPSDY